MRFNGEGIPVAGVNSIGTLPIYRRHGYLSKITARHFELLHEQGERSIAVLNAAKAAIYQRYDYAVVTTLNSYRVPPLFLRFGFPIEVLGRFRELGDSEEEFNLLVELYRRFRADRTGYSHRGRAMWEAGVLADPLTGGVVGKVVYEENGEPLGYTIYAAEPVVAFPASKQNLTIRDVIWLSASAYQAIWNFYATMDRVDEIVWDRVPPDDPLPHLLLEPRMLHLTSLDGLMGRIVDVEGALPKRFYTEEATLTFEVVDDLCPWNNGRWKLETSPAGSSISHTDKEPQLRIPVSTLAMLVFGQISATEAARMVRLDVLDPAALPTWDKTMRTLYRPHCADLF
jgi:predicted acetyltransferase